MTAGAVREELTQPSRPPPHWRESPPIGGKGKQAMKGRSSCGGCRERGAVAVEFALLLPVLLLIVFGIIDFGRALNAQITLTQAAREGARLAALGNSDASVKSWTVNAATGLSLTAGSVSVTDCPANVAAGSVSTTVVVTYSFSFITPVGAIAGMIGGGSGSGFGSPITMTAQGVMPCET
jgi:Flp pilus assembly protein TadG